MEKITEKIFTETSFQGCNPSVVVTKEGLVQIDSPYVPTEALKWREELKNLGEMKYIINTECHSDHVFGNFFLEGIVISHDGAKENFGASQDKLDELFGRMRDLDPEGVSFLEEYVPKEPVITFDHQLTLHLGDEIFKLIHLPGHTPHQVAVFLPEQRALFTGDNVVYRTRPFYHECKPLEWIKSLNALKKLDVNVLIPGHGDVCDKGAINEMISYNEEVFGQVRGAIEQGLSKEETMAKVVFSEKMPLIESQKTLGQVLGPIGISRIYEELISSSQK